MKSTKVTRMAGFSGILVANLIAAIDAVALSVSLPTIADALHLTTIEAFWTGTSFVLANAVCQPLFPAVSNATGRRTSVLIATGLLVIGTVVCGVATGVATLLVGRTVQGVGCGGILSLMYVVMADIFDLRQRASAMAVNGLVWLMGTEIGPMLGGGFSAHVTWRWIFCICLPIAGIAFVLVALFLDSQPADVGRPTQRAVKSVERTSWRHFDFVGSAPLIACLTGFLVPVSWGGTTYAWTSWHTLVPVILSGLGFGLWLTQ